MGKAATAKEASEKCTEESRWGGGEGMHESKRHRCGPVGLFDYIDHDLLMRAVRRHTRERWMFPYILRWLRALVRVHE